MLNQVLLVLSLFYTSAVSNLSFLDIVLVIVLLSRELLSRVLIAFLSFLPLAISSLIKSFSLS
jgi:hypothetical protein